MCFRFLQTTCGAKHHGLSDTKIPLKEKTSELGTLE